MMNKSMIKPKPCPLCGVEVVVVHPVPGKHNIWCNGCYLCLYSDEYATEERMIERWNRRDAGQEKQPEKGV
jgi:methyl coenzyme M reductase subunit C-like uncharacterized protein (methanogenesis marker protein 7)